jgi:hypothetical protein
VFLEQSLEQQASGGGDNFPPVQKSQFMTYKISLYDPNQQVVFEVGGKICDSFASVAASCSNRQLVGSMSR